ncbi:Helitron helicase [Phytophthora megakarya]|uniref:Helitron helicase n=1 Tax=Phytophthora megakarya TaxID=4795 RepID=A0A225WRV9_9STRA|nr:Helitron helicase [Phytophthora megakarya]
MRLNIHMEEALSYDEKKTVCCLEGRVLLALLNDPPGFLKKIVGIPALLCKTRAYNTTLGLTSIGATISDYVAIDTVYTSGRQNVYTFRVQGTICHRIGSVLPEDGAEPSFAQGYVYYKDMEH